MKLDAEKWRAFDALCQRIADRARGDAYDSIESWTDPPTLLGFDHVHPELVGPVPTTEI